MSPPIAASVSVVETSESPDERPHAGLRGFDAGNVATERRERPKSPHATTRFVGCFFVTRGRDAGRGLAK